MSLDCSTEKRATCPVCRLIHGWAIEAGRRCERLSEGHMACDVCGLVLVWPRALQQTAARRDLAPPHSLWESEGDNDTRAPFSDESRGPQRQDRRASKQEDARSNVTLCSTRRGLQPPITWQNWRVTTKRTSGREPSTKTRQPVTRVSCEESSQWNCRLTQAIRGCISTLILASNGASCPPITCGPAADCGLAVATHPWPGRACHDCANAAPRHALSQWSGDTARRAGTLPGGPHSVGVTQPLAGPNRRTTRNGPACLLSRAVHRWPALPCLSWGPCQGAYASCVLPADPCRASLPCLALPQPKPLPRSVRCLRAACGGLGGGGDNHVSVPWEPETLQWSPIDAVGAVRHRIRFRTLARARGATIACGGHPHAQGPPRRRHNRGQAAAIGLGPMHPFRSCDDSPAYSVLARDLCAHFFRAWTWRARFFTALFVCA